MSEKIMSRIELWTKTHEILRKLSQGEEVRQELNELEKNIILLPTSLKDVTRHLDGDISFNIALSKIDTHVVNMASESLIDTAAYVHGRKEPSAELSNLFDRQRNFATYAIISQIDASGLTNEIVRLSTELFANFSFSDCKELIETELFLAKKYGLPMDSSDVMRCMKIADLHKHELASTIIHRRRGAREMDPNTQAAPFVSACSATQRTRGAQAGGAYLGAVNMMGLSAPEPFVSKAIGIASIIAGFLGCLFGD